METSAKKPNWQFPVALASVFLGMLISQQFRVQTNLKMPTKLPDMAKMVKDLEAENRSISDELNKSRTQLAELEQKMGQGSSETKKLAETVKESKIQSGLVPMKGPGIVIKLSDSVRHPGPDEDPHFFIVHDVDLQTLVNELWAAGAEAVSINHQRIVNRTPIRCVGPTILISAVRISAPYTVRAIGPKDDMEGGLKMPGGFVDSMQMLIRSGGEVRISKSDEISVPAFQGSTQMRYAVPETPAEQKKETEK